MWDVRLRSERKLGHEHFMCSTRYRRVRFRVVSLNVAKLTTFCRGGLGRSLKLRNTGCEGFRVELAPCFPSSGNSGVVGIRVVYSTFEDYVAPPKQSTRPSEGTLQVQDVALPQRWSRDAEGSAKTTIGLRGKWLHRDTASELRFGGGWLRARDHRGDFQ